MVILAVILFAGSFVLSVVLTAVAKKLALGRGFSARPSVDRFGERVVPLGGGVAIFACLGFFMAGGIIIVKLLGLAGGLNWLGESVTIHIDGFVSKIPELAIVIAAAGAFCLLGLWDDIKHLRPSTKLIVQFIVALIVAAGANVRVELFIADRIVTSLLSAFWIVMIINAFNFLDNMDGASGGIAAITVAILFVMAASSGQVFVGALSIVFVGTMLGFLIFNFCPASIYMGDAGSFVVGFFVAILTLRTTYYHQAQSGRWYAVLTPLVIMALPLYDFISVTILRIAQGKSPFVGDTQHFSHRLKKRGLSETQAVLTLYLATLCTGAGAIVLSQVSAAYAILIFVQTVMILAIIAVLETAGNDGTSARV